VKSAPPTARVVLVPIDASPQSMAALETAAIVASRLNAELRGMYVEDIDLLRTAELPFASVINSSGQSQPLTSESMQRQLRRQAELARNAVEAASARSHISWSFSVVRGTVHREIARAASGADFVALGRSGWSPKAMGELGSVVRTLVKAANNSLLMAGEGGIRAPLAVIYDGSPSSDRALILAEALNGNGPWPIVVLLTGESSGLLKSKTNDALFEIIVTNPSGLAGSIDRSGAKTVFMPAVIPAMSAHTDRILNRRDISVFLMK